MTVICANCPACGKVEITADAVELTVTDPAERSSYTFTCPSCGDRIRKRADANAVTLLIHGGVSTQVLAVPAEAMEPHTGPVLTLDDLLDLHISLARL